MNRIRIYAFSIVVLFVAVWLYLGYIQLIKGDDYRNLSEKNRLVIIPLTAPRGEILDRNDVPIADNRTWFDASIIYSDAKDVNEISDIVSKVTGAKKKEIAKKIIYARNRPFSPVTMVEDIDREQAILLEQYNFDYPGILVTTKPSRSYPYKKIASTIIGYLGMISESEFTRYRTYGYRMNDLVGKSGLEKEYESYLQGTKGGMQIEVDSLGRKKRILTIFEPLPGKNIKTTLDVRLQKYCDELMGNRKGSIICLDPQTGEVLTLVSKPNFDPAIFISPDKIKDLLHVLYNEEDNYPLLNRGISCSYPPGSVFKCVLATAALENGIIDEQDIFTCNGAYKVGRRYFHCWRESGHGEVSIAEAIKYSCNVFFYQLGLRVGVDEISKCASRFGFGEKTGIDLPGEIPGFVPTRQWKRDTFHEKWYPGDTANFSIGQGYLLVTPLQLVRMMAVIANNGNLVRPYIVKSIENLKIDSQKISKTDISPDALAIVKEGLKKVVNDARGTGMKARSSDVVISGKTGTAQNMLGKNHGWFSGFAPFDEPRICVVVFVEFGGKGGLEASILARKAIEKSKELGII